VFIMTNNINTLFGECHVLPKVSNTCIILNLPYYIFYDLEDHITLIKHTNFRQFFLKNLKNLNQCTT
jgi:hypothetical protein